MAGKVIKFEDVQLLATEDRAIWVRPTINSKVVPEISIDAGWASVSPNTTFGDVHTKDEIYFIISGEAQVVLDGEESAIAGGDTVYIPAGCRHGIVNRSDAELKLFFLFPSPIEIPSGEEPELYPVSAKE